MGGQSAHDIQENCCSGRYPCSCYTSWRPYIQPSFGHPSHSLFFMKILDENSSWNEKRNQPCLTFFDPTSCFNNPCITRFKKNWLLLFSTWKLMHYLSKSHCFLVVCILLSAMLALIIQTWRCYIVIGMRYCISQ